MRAVLLACLLTPALAGPAAGAQADWRLRASAEWVTRTGIESASPITLADALALTLANNRELSAASRELSAAQASLLQSQALPNPELSAGFEELGKPSRSTSLQLSQLIELGGKRSARIRAAGYGRDAAVSEYEAKRIDTLTRVAQAFVDVLAAQRRKQLADEAVGVALQGAEVVGKRVAAGKVSPVEETKARLEAASARVEAEQAGRELASTRVRLSAFWGNPTPRFTQASGDLERLPVVPDLAQLAQRARSSPEIARADAEVSRREALLDGERAKRIPDVTLGAGVKRVQESRENLPMITLSVPLPLFDQNRGNVSEALHRLEKARDERAALDTRVVAELGQAYEQLKAVQAELRTLREEVLPGAKSAYDAARTGYELGKFGFLDVLDAQRTLFQAGQQYVKALAEYHRTTADLERLAGGDLPAPGTTNR